MDNNEQDDQIALSGKAGRMMFMILAKSMSEDSIIERIEEDIKDYKLGANREEALQHLKTDCLLLLTKDRIADEGLNQAMERIEEIDQADNLVKRMKGKIQS